MARTLTTEGMSELSQMFDKLGAEAGNIAAKALYSGAKIVADSITAAAAELQTEPFRFASESNPRLCSPLEKEAIQNRVAGIAKFDKSGAEVSTAVGLKDAGYVGEPGKSTPIPLLVRSINSGASFRVKQPFFRQAVNKSKGEALRKIASEVEKAVEEITR